MKRRMSTSPGAVGMAAFLEFERRLTSNQHVKSTVLSAAHVVQPPTEPRPDDCCDRDCPNCVLLKYQEDLAAYEAFLSSSHPKVPTLFHLEGLEHSYDGVVLEAEHCLVTKPHRGRVVSNESIASELRLVTLDVMGIPGCKSGGNVNIVPQNPQWAVDVVLPHVTLDNGEPIAESTAVIISPSSDEFTSNAVPNVPVSAVSLLAWSIDLMTSPTPQVANRFASLLGDSDVATLLMQLAGSPSPSSPSPSSSSLASCISDPAFPSLTLSQLLHGADALLPRPYSIAGTQMAHGEDGQEGVVELLVSTRGGGACAEALGSAVSGDDFVVTMTDSAFSEATDLLKGGGHCVLVGAGAGLAPLRAAAAIASSSSLFFGCKTESDELGYPLPPHCNHVSVAHSKSGKYVQDLLRTDIGVREVQKALDSNGTILVCGMPGLTKGVLDAVHDILGSENVRIMEKSGRIITESW